MTDPPPFERRLLFGYDPDDVERSFAQMAGTIEQLERELAERTVEAHDLLDEAADEDGGSAEPRRAVLGYHPEDVERTIADRDRTIRRLEAQLRMRPAATLEEHGSDDDSPDSDTSGEPRRAFRGYDRDEVRQLVARLHRRIGRSEQEAGRLQVRIATLEEALDSWREKQHQLDALALRAAQDAERIRDEAERLGHGIVAAAQAEARQAAAAVEREHAQLERLREIRHRMTSGIRTAMERFEQSLVETSTSEEPQLPVETPEDSAEPAGRLYGLQGGRHDVAVEPARADDPVQATERQHLRAGPFADYAELATFVRSLEALAPVDEVFVESFEGEWAELAVHVDDAERFMASLDSLEGIDVRGGADVTTVRVGAVAG